MILAINIGNTNVRFGVFDEEKLIKTFLIPTKEKRDYQKEILKQVQNDTIRKTVIASVVPAHNKKFTQICWELFQEKPVFIHELFKLGELGADIFCGVTAAYHLYGGPGLVIDLGTATTFNAVDKDGNLLGVAIAPGLQTAHKALIHETALLHEVPLIAPDSVIGKDTTTAIQSGVIFGYVDLIEGMIKRFKAELGQETQVIATGGLSPLVGKYTHVFSIIDTTLTLKGIQLLAH
jgi:type III pantothenate kinase